MLLLQCWVFDQIIYKKRLLKPEVTDWLSEEQASLQVNNWYSIRTELETTFVYNICGSPTSIIITVDTPKIND